MDVRPRNHPSSWLLLLTHLLLLIDAVQGKLIICLCTTKHCVAQNTKTCNTTNMCYTQFLDLKDGSEPVTHGCINDKTPLLCENRRPAVPSAKWPLLLCCNVSMCNENVAPTIPPWFTQKPPGNLTDPSTSPVFLPPDVPPSEVVTPRQLSLSPVYIAVLVVGVCLLIIIGAVAMVVLRRHQRFYNNEFGIDRNSYLKGQCAQDIAAATKLNDPENAKSGMYDNKVILST